MNTQKNQDASLAEELPYWEFIEGKLPHAILYDGSLVAGLDVELKDIECLDDHEINQTTMQLRSMLNSLSEGTTLQFYLNVDSNFNDKIESHQKLMKYELPELLRKIFYWRTGDLKEGAKHSEFYRPRLKIFIRNTGNLGSKFSLFGNQNKVFETTHQSYDDALDLLRLNIDTISSSLGSIGLNPKLLSRTEMLNQVYRFLNPMRSKENPAPYVPEDTKSELGKDLLLEANLPVEQSPRERLCFGDLILSEHFFNLDAFDHKVITLKSLPEVTYAGQMSNFLQMPFHYDLLFTIHVPFQNIEMQKLNQKRKMAHSMASTQSGAASDLESESKLSSTEELIRELLNTGQRIYSSELSIILKTPSMGNSHKILNRQAQDVLSRFRSLQGAEGLVETVGAWKVLKSNLPLAPIHLERQRKMKTNNAADFLPIYGPRVGDKEASVIFRNRLNGLVSFNAFDPNLPNYNCLVTGSSGAGKSFLNNCILLQEMSQGLRVFVVDIGGSYKKLTNALGGQFLEINLSDNYCINPFDIPDIKAGPSDQKIKSLLAILECMILEDEKSKLTKLDRALMEKSILDLYEEKRKLGAIPTLSDLKIFLSKSSEVSLQTISKMLYLWTGDRPYGKLLDGQGKLRADASICTFDLKGLSNYPDLQSVMILILTDFIFTQVETDKVNKKRIIMDEVWALLKTTSAANFMEYCARTLRKSGSGITFITQSIEEIASSPIGPAILNNTATKFVMLQRGDIKILKENLKLNKRECELIFSLEQKKGKYSEGFMIEGNHRQVIRVHPIPLEYWVSTSDAQDNHYLDHLMKSGMSLVESIEKAAKIFPFGVTQEKLVEA